MTRSDKSSFFCSSCSSKTNIVVTSTAVNKNRYIRFIVERAHLFNFLWYLRLPGVCLRADFQMMLPHCQLVNINVYTHYEAKSKCCFFSITLPQKDDMSAHKILCELPSEDPVLRRSTHGAEHKLYLISAKLMDMSSSGIVSAVAVLHNTCAHACSSCTCVYIEIGIH